MHSSNVFRVGTRPSNLPPSQFETAFVPAAHDEAAIDAFVTTADEALGV